MTWGVYRYWPAQFTRRWPTPPLPSTAAKIIAAMTTPPSASHAAAINTYVNDLIAAGIWAKIEYLQVYRAQDTQAANINWKDPANGPTANPVNSPGFTAFLGYDTNGTNSEVDTNANPSLFTLSGQDDACFLVGHDGTNITTGSVVGWYDGTDGSTMSFRKADNTFASRMNQASSLASSATITSAVGLYAVNRSASNAMQSYKDGVSKGTAATVSVARNNNTLRLGRTQTAAYEIGTFGMSAYCRSLNSTEQAAFSAAWAAFKLATASTVYPIAASIAGAATITADIGRTAPMAAVIAGVGQVAAADNAIRPVAASIAGAASIAAADSAIRPVAASIAGAASIAADINRVNGATATLAATSSLSCAIGRKAPIAASIVGAGALTAQDSGRRPIAATLSGVAAIISANIDNPSAPAAVGDFLNRSRKRGRR